MKNILTVFSIVLALAASASSALAQTVSLGGSDSWEPVIRQAFLTDTGRANGADLATFLAYSGGGQTPGETALKGNFGIGTATNQVIAFFTRQLTDTGTATTGNSANICLINPNAQDIVIAVDGIINVGHPSVFTGNPTLGGGGSGLTWQNTLSILYSGYDLTNPGAGNQCGSTARRGLAADYRSLFASSNIAANTPIRHIYRRGDAAATATLFLQLLGIPSANRTWCNGTDNQDLDPIRRNALQTDQVAEFDGTLGLVLSIVVPTFSNTQADLYFGANGSTPATFGKLPGAQGPLCGSAPSSIDPSTGVTYAGLVVPAGGLDNNTRCDCRYPTPANFGTASTTSDARRFNWNVQLGIGCQVPQAATGTTNPWNVLNGDDGQIENVPAPWGSLALAGASATNVPQLPTGRRRCCNVGSPSSFRREDPRLVNLWVRNPANGNLRPTQTAPVLATYRLAATDQGLSNIDRPFTPLCAQNLASDLQVSCLVTSVPGDVNSIGFGALPIFKDNASVSLPPTQPFNLNTDPIASNFASIRDRSYGLSRYVFLSSLRGFTALGESATSHTGNAASFAYDAAASTTQRQLDAQWNLAKAIYTDARRPDRQNAAVELFGFLALDPSIDPYAVACTDDANSPSATRIALNNATYFAK